MTYTLSKSLLSYILFVLLCPTAFTQSTAVFERTNHDLDKASTSYQMGLYAQAAEQCRAYLERTKPIEGEEKDANYDQIDLLYRLSLLYSDREEAQDLLVDYIANYQPSVYSQKASIALADYYFDSKSYKQALIYYASIDVLALSDEDLCEAKFRQGFSYFNLKDFESANRTFDQMPHISHSRVVDADYYSGVSHYYLENYNAAMSSFGHLDNSSKYAQHVPYYNAVIMANQENWNEVIAYLQPIISNERLRNKTSLNQILGRAYFEQGQYTHALTFLEYHDSRVQKMLAPEIYQLAYTRYKNNKYQSASSSFIQLSNEETALGQSANFYLADCYLKLDNKKSARNAFAKAAKSDFDQHIKDEALFNYALLSMDFHDDRVAVGALIQIDATSNNYEQAQDFLAQIFLNTQDFKKAIEILSTINRNTTALKQSYQRVTYFYAIQEVDILNYATARAYFNKSAAEVSSSRIQVACLFWLGYIDHKEGQLNQSDKYLTDYIKHYSGNTPSQEAVPAMANYLLGYNYYEQQMFSKSTTYFNRAVNKQLPDKIKSDAYMRLADSQFKLNKYNDAIKNYTESIRYDTKYQDYVKFQKGILYGLQGSQVKKIDMMNTLVATSPSSSYASYAVYEKAITQMEINRDQAMETFYALIKSYPNSPLVNKANLHLGLMYYNNGESQRAINRYRLVLNNNPSEKESKEAIASVEEIFIQDLKSPDGYASFLDDFPSYKLDRGRQEALIYKIAYEYYEDGHYEEAVTAFDAYLQRYKAGARQLDAFYYRAESKVLLQKYHEAYQDYENLIAKGPNPHYQSSLYKAAVIAQKHDQNYDKALDHYRALAQLGPSPDQIIEIYQGALFASVKLGNHEAINTYADYIIGDPLFSERDKGLAYFHSAQVAQNTHDLNKALIRYNKASRLLHTEEAAEANYSIGQIYLNRNQYDLAETYAEAAINKNASYPYWVAKNLLLLSDALSAKGDYFNAQAAVEAVLENYRDDKDIATEARRRLNQLKKKEAVNTRLDKNIHEDNIQFQKDDQR